MKLMIMLPWKTHELHILYDIEGFSSYFCVRVRECNR